MPYASPPPNAFAPSMDDVSTPLKLAGDPIADSWALKLVDESMQRFEMWRVNNCDQRWKLNDWLYYGYVPVKNWEGTNIAKSNFSDQITFYQVEAAFARLCGELLSGDQLFSVFPEGDTDVIAARQIQDRLNYILDHNLDDYGWTARCELELILKDMLIYGNGFGLVEWDGTRKQAVVLRIDPRDVYLDPATPGAYIERSRGTIVKKSITVDEAEAMRGFKKYRIPPKEQLVWLANNRTLQIGDRAKVSQESARGVRYLPTADDLLPLPASQFIDLYVYMGGGREIWTLGRGITTGVCIYNETEQYGCTRIISAPCFTVPNRFYAQSFVDVLDPAQNMKSALLNAHFNELSLALNPPRIAKRGIIRPPGQHSWRPGMELQYENPKEDVIVHQPPGITTNIWTAMGYLDSYASNMLGQNSMSTSGTPSPSNANRTRGGVQAQMQAPTERLAKIAANFETYLLTPMLYKLLRVESQMLKNTKDKIYGSRSSVPSTY